MDVEVVTSITENYMMSSGILKLWAESSVQHSLVKPIITVY